MYCDEECEYVAYSAKSFLYYTLGYNKYHFVFTFTACPFTLCREFFTPKIVGTFYMQGYKVKEKTAIVPHCTPVSKLSGHPDLL